VRIERVVTNVPLDVTPSKGSKKVRSQRSSKSKIDEVPLENKPSKIKSVTEALLHKIKKESYSKFNKSSMIVKFASKEDKAAVLNQ
jgi:hypothetical protein